MPQDRWTNESVAALAQGTNPVKKITERAQEVVFKALDAGWSGPPFDPISLAEHLNISIEPRDDIRDARTVPTGEEHSKALILWPTKLRTPYFQIMLKKRAIACRDLRCRGMNGN